MEEFDTAMTEMKAHFAKDVHVRSGWVGWERGTGARVVDIDRLCWLYRSISLHG